MSDLISRDALRLMKAEECKGHTIEYAQGWKACIEWIKALPSEEIDKRLIPKSPVFRKGESIAFVDYSDGTGGTRTTEWAEWCCPNCGWFVGEQYIPRKHNQSKSNYCSRCGQAIDWNAVEPEKYALHEKERKELEELRRKIAMKGWNKNE